MDFAIRGAYGVAGSTTDRTAECRRRARDELIRSAVDLIQLPTIWLILITIMMSFLAD